MFKTILLTIPLIIFASISNAALLTVKDDYVTFDGAIEPGDAIRLVQLLQTTGIREVHLNSPGGVAIEGYNLGYGMRELKVKLVIDEESTCMSACAIMFLGGTEQVLDGLIGFHSPHIPENLQTGLNISETFSNGQGIAITNVHYFYTMGYNLQLQTLITQLTRADTFLVFKDLDELNKFTFNEGRPFGDVIKLTNDWVAEHIAGPIRMHFLKPSKKKQITIEEEE